MSAALALGRCGGLRLLFLGVALADASGGGGKGGHALPHLGVPAVAQILARVVPVDLRHECLLQYVVGRKHHTRCARGGWADGGRVK